MDYRVRAATAKDQSIIWEMLRYASHESSVKSVQQQPLLARYALEWGITGDCGYIAEQNTLHLGMAWLRLWLREDKGFGYVSDQIPELAIAVLPDYRGKGIGTHLLQEILVIAASPKHRFPGVSLSVRADNPAVRLYERLGFIKVSGSEVVNRLGEISFNMLHEFG